MPPEPPVEAAQPSVNDVALRFVAARLVGGIGAAMADATQAEYSSATIQTRTINFGILEKEFVSHP